MVTNENVSFSFENSRRVPKCKFLVRLAKIPKCKFFGAEKPKCKLSVSGYENVSKISVEDENVLVHEIIFPLFILSISGATKRRIFGFKCSTMFAFFYIEMFDVRMFAISATKILGFLLFGCDIFRIAEIVQKIRISQKLFDERT